MSALPENAGLLLTALGERDRYTHEHSGRVEALAAELGRSCGLSLVEQGILRLASVFHDIGKIGVPDSVLLKNGPLEDHEWPSMKAHSAIGERILSRWSHRDNISIAKAVRHHHEHFDGGGYPDRLKRDDIPLISRIISIADGYDAMAIGRSYHPGHTHEVVMKALKDETGSKYDPGLFARFEALIDVSPLRAPSVS